MKHVYRVNEIRFLFLIVPESKANWIWKNAPYFIMGILFCKNESSSRIFFVIYLKVALRFHSRAFSQICCYYEASCSGKRISKDQKALIGIICCFRFNIFNLNPFIFLPKQICWCVLNKIEGKKLLFCGCWIRLDVYELVVTLYCLFHR